VVEGWREAVVAILRERDESVTGELCLCVVQGASKLVYFLPVLRYASQPLDMYVRFATFT